VAEHIAASTPSDRSILVDVFAGAGGNTIAFALSGRWKRVYAIESDHAHLACAKHNAKIYGVDKKITWFEGDCFDILKNQLKDLGPYSVVFGSPPWGGPGYRLDDVFNVETMKPYSLQTLCEEFSMFSPYMVYYLPRSSNLKQLAKYVEAGEQKSHIIHYCIEGASKALCVFYGGFHM